MSEQQEAISKDKKDETEAASSSTSNDNVDTTPKPSNPKSSPPASYSSFLLQLVKKCETEKQKEKKSDPDKDVLNALRVAYMLSNQTQMQPTSVRSQSQIIPVPVASASGSVIQNSLQTQSHTVQLSTPSQAFQNTLNQSNAHGYAQNPSRTTNSEGFNAADQPSLQTYSSTAVSNSKPEQYQEPPRVQTPPAQTYQDLQNADSSQRYSNLSALSNVTQILGNPSNSEPFDSRLNSLEYRDHHLQTNQDSFRQQQNHESSHMLYGSPQVADPYRQRPTDPVVQSFSNIPVHSNSQTYNAQQNLVNSQTYSNAVSQTGNQQYVTMSPNTNQTYGNTQHHDSSQLYNNTLNESSNAYGNAPIQPGVYREMPSHRDSQGYDNTVSSANPPAYTGTTDQHTNVYEQTQMNTAQPFGGQLNVLSTVSADNPTVTAIPPTKQNQTPALDFSSSKILENLAGRVVENDSNQKRKKKKTKTSEELERLAGHVSRLSGVITRHIMMNLIGFKPLENLPEPFRDIQPDGNVDTVEERVMKGATEFLEQTILKGLREGKGGVLEQTILQSTTEEEFEEARPAIEEKLNQTQPPVKKKRYQTYTCKFCGKGFRFRTGLDEHVLMHTGYRPFTCQICRKGFTKRSTLTSHMRVHTGERPNRCSICGKGFFDSSTLTKHLRIHTGDRPFKCSICGKAFSQKFVLDGHLRTHSGVKPFKCNTCGKSFRSSGTLQRHWRTHTGEKPYKCQECGKGFGDGSTYKRHLRMHRGIKPYKCDLCDQTFSDKRFLKRHMWTHSSTKPHSCEYCGKEFIDKGALKTHIRTHTGDKPYMCEICGRGFSQGSSLKSHSRIHTGERPFLCVTCGKDFTNNSTFQKHMAMHKDGEEEEEEQQKCDYCGVIFPKSILLKHIRSHHTMNNEVLCEIGAENVVKHYTTLH